METETTGARSVEVDRDGLSAYIDAHKERCGGRLEFYGHLDLTNAFVNSYQCSLDCGSSVAIESARGKRKGKMERIFVVQPSERTETNGDETTVST